MISQSISHYSILLTRITLEQEKTSGRTLSSQSSEVEMLMPLMLLKQSARRSSNSWVVLCPNSSSGERMICSLNTVSDSYHVFCRLPLTECALKCQSSTSKSFSATSPSFSSSCISCSSSRQRFRPCFVVRILNL